MKLVFLNDYYPYASEPFVENELMFLPADIEGYLIPLYPQKSTRTTPEKIKNLQVVAKRKKTVREVTLLKRCFSKRLWDELRTVCQKGHAVYNMARTIKFYCHAEYQVLKVQEWLRKNSSDRAFVFYSYWMYREAYVAARLKELFPESKFITRCHGYDLYEERHPYNYIPFRAYIFAAADSICPVSQCGEDYLLKTYGQWLEPKIRIMRLGSLSNKPEISNLNYNKNILHIISCSSISQVKRLDRLIDALARMKEEINWNHFGEGPLREELIELANTLPPNIHWNFMGYKPNIDVLDYYQKNQADIFVNTSESEGIPVSIMEAMSCGIPVIAPDIGGISEIVHDGVNGFLLDSNFTPAMLAQKLSAFFKLETGKRNSLKKNAKRTWEETYNAKRNYQIFLATSAN